VRVPVKAGDSWTVELETPAGSPPLQMIYTIIGEENVDLPAGRFKAVRVDTGLAPDQKKLSGSYWYAPGIGLVKSVTKIGKDDRIQVLKSFSAAKK
jgi:hypothetical protein